MKQIPFRIVGLQVESFVLNDNQLRDKKAVAVNTSYEFGVKTRQSYFSWHSLAHSTLSKKISTRC